LTKFLGGVGHGPGTNEFNVGDDPDHCPCIIELPTDFDEISWRAGVWPRDQLIILVTIRITIRIRESVPDHDPDPGRTATIMLAFGEGLCSLSTSSLFLFSCLI